MIKQVDVTKFKITKVSQGITLIIFAILYIIGYFRIKSGISKEIVFFITLAYLLFGKVPHELSHYFIGRICGFKCKIKYGLYISQCIFEGKQNYKQLIFQSLAPSYLYIPIIIVLLAIRMPLSLKFVSLSLFTYSVGTMIGDFIYVYFALKNKNASFIDTGHILEIHEPDANLSPEGTLN